MKSGTAVFFGCTITAVGAYYDPGYDGNNAHLTGNALMLECSPSPEYFQTLNVTIIGGIFSSAYGYAVELAGTSADGTHDTSYAKINISGAPALYGYLGETNGFVYP